jgi:pimeloyl-ACP methyl ester carboxylesterase
LLLNNPISSYNELAYKMIKGCFVKRIVIRVLAGLALLIMLASAGFVIWALDANELGADAAAALNSDADVTVQTEGDQIVFTPAAAEAVTGLIFYPGGRVDYRAYAPVLRRVAEAGYPVILLRVPLNLAVFDVNRAGEVKQAHPQIRNWVVAGHSLGGSMAAAYAYQQPEAVDGLVMWAAYPAESNDLSARPLPVLSISAANDGLATPDKIAASRAFLPASTQFVVVEGGNHAQFGDYGQQDGDGQAQIPAEEQWAQVAQATIAFMEQINREVE